MKRILVVDDEKAIRDTLRMVLEYEKFRVSEAESGDRALEALERESVDAILLDVKMPGRDGLDTLTEIRRRDPDAVVVMISAHANLHTAVEATRKGAFDFLEKPLDTDRLLLAVRNALERSRLVSENKAFKDRGEGFDILGKSPLMAEVLALVERVAPTNARVLVTGENGTGKELIARAIHNKSPRASERFVEVNCAAIPKDLIESELFGHEKGSFTGAVGSRAGKFQQADGGTLFLDEIGDMSLSAQAKVLRGIETGRIERVGGQEPVPVDVRIVAATNKDLARQVAEGEFREDLLYRLQVIPIRLPPLRERADDIPNLARHFLARACAENGWPAKGLSDGAVRVLQSRRWPGNVRELKNGIERLAILVPGDSISEDDVERWIPRTVPVAGPSADAGLLDSPTHEEFKERSERAFLERKLQAFGWNISKVSEVLQMPRSNLYKKLEKYGLKKPEPPGLAGEEPAKPADEGGA
ncbi:MAG: sigma-54 dependent transcriptional regulator [Planctomycetota bacterium]